MGRKRILKNAARDEEWEGASVVSLAGSTSTLGRLDETNTEIERPEDAFLQAIEDTYESRGSTREAAFGRLCAAMRQRVCSEECHQNAATLIDRCMGAIKKGGAGEAALAATALGLHALTLGEPDEAAFDALAPDLARAMRHGKSAAARAAAADALALCCFVMAEHDDPAAAAMAALQGQWAAREPAAALRAGALRAWSFLFTSLSNLPGADAVEALLPALAALLHESDVELRAAAGEAIAVVCHSVGLDSLEAVVEGGGDDEDEDEEEDDGDEGSSDGQRQRQQQQQQPAAAAGALLAPNGGSSSGSNGGDGGDGGSDAPPPPPPPSGLSDVVGRMRLLATNRADARRRSKRDRAALRSAFRDISAAVERGSVRETKIKLQHGDVLRVSTLAGSVALGFLRRALAGGFQAHLQGSALLHAVFDYAPRAGPAARLSALEKRALRSPGSAACRQRAVARRGQRAHKGAAAGGGGGGEDDGYY